MAYFEKTASGKWRCCVMVNYKRHTKTFKTKQEGNAWAVTIEQGGFLPANKTFGDLLDEYYKKISINKKGERWERIRIEKLKKDKLCNVKLSDLRKSDFADWRDRRLKEVSNSSVIREWTLLNHAIVIAINEWEWLKDNPMKGLKKPASDPARERILSDDEIVNLCHALNYTHEIDLNLITSRVGAALLFAIETALRAQEICNLTWSDVKGRTIKVTASKTYTGIREVPLSAKAISILEQCKGVDERLVFNLTTSQIDSLFRKAKSYLMIDDLHWHDSRATAITRLASKLNILELARMVGHRDLRMLQVYYRESAESIADKL